MGMLNVLRVAGSALTAQRLRMDVAASNLANAETTRTAEGGPYQRQSVVFTPYQLTGAGTNGVMADAIVNPQQQPKRVYDPGHPDADAEGYVTLPNVNSVSEMVDLVTASRGYEANVTVMQTAKQMFTKTLEILR